MGIKHFWGWFNNQFGEDIYKLKKSDTFDDIGANVDVMLIDMNGIFHNSTQKIYKYGNSKVNKRLLRKEPVRDNVKTRIKVFEDVCATVELILSITEPKKKLVMCVDGCAPLSKQAQQRQRRFKSAMSAEENAPFDSNCITPGTKFMDHLTKYIDWYIRMRISQKDNTQKQLFDWSKIEVVFSNEKVAGEGEHKLLNFLRKYGNRDDSYCLHGLDADLIMLALGTHLPNFFILRDDLYDRTNDFFCIDIGCIRQTLSELLEWHSEDYIYDSELGVYDFIFLCFIVGNDFLPHIPSIEIIEDGIDVMVDVYIEVATSFGHLVEKGARLTPGTDEKNHIRFRKESMQAFLSLLGTYEKELLENKLDRKGGFFTDNLLESCAIRDTNTIWNLDIDKYRQEYISQHFPKDIDEKTICHEYLSGMQWVLTYYTEGVPHWKWNFPFHYTPSAFIIAKHVKSFEHKKWGISEPSTPFQQLLSVLPPKSAKFIPSPLDELLTNHNSVLKKFCPDDVEVDLSGMRREWEGIVKLPMVDFELVRQIYLERIREVEPKEKRRDKRGNTYSYFYNKNMHNIDFNSYYGNILGCKCGSKLVL